jgi:hypothetical protein
MWLDAVPYAPSVCFDDQSFQDASRVRMGLRAFSAATAGRVLSFTRLRATTSRMLLAATGSAVSCKAAMMTLQRCCESSSVAWAFPPAARQGTPGLHPARPTARRHDGTFTATHTRPCARCRLLHPPSRCFVHSLSCTLPGPCRISPRRRQAPRLFRRTQLPRLRISRGLL